MASTRKGMMTWREGPRLEAPKPKAAAKQSMPVGEVVGLAGLIDTALRLVKKKLARLAAANVFSAYVGAGLKRELSSMLQELEDMQCMDLKDPKTFRKCQAKYIGISKRLDRTRGFP